MLLKLLSKKLYNNKKGQEIVEWGIIVLFISVLTMATLFAFAPRMQDLLARLTDTYNNAFINKN